MQCTYVKKQVKVMLKVIYFLDLNQYVQYEMRILENLQHYGYRFTVIDWVKELGLNYRNHSAQTAVDSADDVRRLYNAKDQMLLDLYNKIRNLSKTHDVLIVNQSHILLPEFIESLRNNIYT